MTNFWRHYDTNDVDITRKRNGEQVHDDTYEEDSDSDDSINTIQKILNNGTNNKTNKINENNIDDGKCDYVNFIQLIESFLCFHAWYKSTVAFEWNIIKEGELLLSIRKMSYRLQLTFLRNEGNGWKLQKLNEKLHLTY